MALSRLIKRIVKLMQVRGARPWAVIGGIVGGVFEIIRTGNPLNVLVAIAIGAFSFVVADLAVSRSEKKRRSGEDS
jgi:hypothetical protein